MLEQEIKNDQDTSTATITTTNTTITSATSTTTSINQPSKEEHHQQHEKSDSNNHIVTASANPLNDHDYCSPNKKALKQPIKVNKVDEVDSPAPENTSQQSGRERRQRRELVDPEFCQLSSSEYSSSKDSDPESDSDDDGEDDDEDDPNRPWCVCNKPHNNLFMICCDICEYWYHGHCVGVTEAHSIKYQKAGKEWHCSECLHQLDNGVPRDAIPKKVVKKEKKKKPVRGRGRGRGRPRKTDVATRASLRNTRKSTSSNDSRVGTRRSLPNKSSARIESFEEFDDNEKLKALIRERKREFFMKRNLVAQEKAKLRELGLAPLPLTNPSLGSSLNSLASSTSTPNMSNLPINIKSEHKEKSKPNIVLQISTKKDATSDQNSQRIVTTVVKSKKRKQSESNDSSVNELFTAEPLHISKKSKAHDVTSTANTSQSGDVVPPGADPKGASPSSVKLEKTTEPTERTPKKKRKNSESTAASGSSGPIGSRQIAQKIRECLETRYKQLKDCEVSSNRLDTLSLDIERALNECFKEGSQKYLNKYRSLIFNLRDQKNEILVRNVLSGAIEPSRLVRMSPEELAPKELAKWREEANKHSIEMIKRDAQMAAQQVIVKKTHKGEEVIAAPSLNDPDDITAVTDNQEPPTTPTKMIAKDGRSTEITKQSQSPTTNDTTIKTSGTIKLKIGGGGANIEASPKVDQTPSPSLVESLPFTDTTKDHNKNHLFDINCKICNKEKVDDDVEDDKATAKNQDTSSSQGKTSNEVHQQQPEQPKRLRVSIDTNIDPANLSRLKEPLIKPSETTVTEPGECSPSKVSPQSNSNEDEAEEELYDPERVADMSIESSLTASPLAPSNPNEPCWSGTLTVTDVGKFSAFAKPVSGNTDFVSDEVRQNMVVCGRVPPDQVFSYIKKLRGHPIILIQFHPEADDDKINFDRTFDYLYSRNRCAVISHSSQMLKDFYILPIHEKQNIPDLLKPINGPGLDRKQPNCLMGLLIKTKRPASASSGASSYTPTPINK